MYGNKISIFAEKHLDEFLRRIEEQISAQVEKESDDYLLNVNEIEYVNYLKERFTVESLELKFKDMFVSTTEKEIPAERFPFSFDVRPGHSYKKDAIKYHIPYIGNQELLRCKPSAFLMWTVDVILEDNCVCFEIINFHDNAEEIKREANNIKDNISRQSANVLSQVNRFNASLENHIKNVFQSRKQRLLKKNNLVASLGVPIKKRDDIPKTFAIPTSQSIRNVQISKPSVTVQGYKPDPALDESIYKEILQIIFDVGKQFERLPSTYADKDEETLRDHFLLQLAPRFSGSATGETFNKSGKTDILIRYENSNVFIAECKFWRGQKSFLETITQLLRYLTWRDSKAAVILFVQNKEFSSVIQIVQQSAPTHSNYLGFVNLNGESWLNYRFHIDGDPNREVKLAILLFHIPKVN